ncbi:hypothetical protein GC197_04080 [bacterium]|nr:hypothetical protein [bacterium]
MRSPSHRWRRLRVDFLENRYVLSASTGQDLQPPTVDQLITEVSQPADAGADQSTSFVLEGEASDVPTINSPLEGDVVQGTTVTLSFNEISGYNGNYLVRLDDNNWDGTQASGFNHDCNSLYLCVSTTEKEITVPVIPGHSYRWWVHQPDHSAGGASFTVAESQPQDTTQTETTDPTPVSTTPTITAPLDGDVIDGTTVTLSYEPYSGYDGPYMVRLADANWDGQQAAGFNHDCTTLYLCVYTTDREITVPVKPGHSYRWWVHHPDHAADSASFSVAEATPDPNPTPDPQPTPQPDPNSNNPTILSPQEGDVIDTATVQLSYDPVPGYSGTYMVRLSKDNWDGAQAPGFQHDCDSLYLCIITTETSITVPVDPGSSYRWWVHETNMTDVSIANFTTAEAPAGGSGGDTGSDPAPVLTKPMITSPVQGDVIDGTSVTLSFEGITGYDGPYLVRLDDQNWDGQQASGFTHDCNSLYLCISTTEKQITVPVKPGHNYRWWVHRPDHEADGASFSVSDSGTGGTTNPPAVITKPMITSPVEGTVINTSTVDLNYDPVPGYSGTYMVRLMEENWDGQQAPGFNHDCDSLYLCIITTDTSITVPVDPGLSYRWWVHKTNINDPDIANFSTAPVDTGGDGGDTGSNPAVTAPTIISPMEGSVIDSSTVTLNFDPATNYSGSYWVRLMDDNWDGQQAAGFTHDCTSLYLCIATTQTSISVPVKPNKSYRWWVQEPGGVADVANFTTSDFGSSDPGPQIDNPIILTPKEGDVVDSEQVTLQFNPVPGYLGDYQVRMSQENWDGQQAIGFDHDCDSLYLCVATKATSITVPVAPGQNYSWWVQIPNQTASLAHFSTAPSSTNVTPIDENTPAIISPKEGDEVNQGFMTLEFTPLPNYTGNYTVRLQPTNWDGKQVQGYTQTSNNYYLSISTTSNRIVVPVEPDTEYTWSVQKPGFAAVSETFTTKPVQLEQIDDRYLYNDLAQYSGTNIDVSPYIKAAIDLTPVGGTLELPAGRYMLDHQILFRKQISMTTIGKTVSDPASDLGTHDYAELVASANFSDQEGLIRFELIDTMHHIVLDGNRENRQGTTAARQVSNGNNRYGFVSTMAADNATFIANQFIYALGGTGMEVNGVRNNVHIEDNIYAYNGLHNVDNMWADGLTVHDARNSEFIGNTLIDNTDIDLIFGGGANTLIEGNKVMHTADVSGGAFAAIMIQKWSSTSGDYSGAIIRNNEVDGGPNRTSGPGLYIGSEGWYNETPFGTTTANPVRAEIYGNSVKNTIAGAYIAARDFDIYGNSYQNSSGVSFNATCGTEIAHAPIVVSPTASNIDYHGEDTDPATKDLFDHQSWKGCVPNYPF